MGPLKSAMAAFCLLCAAPARADPVDRWSTFIAEASQRFGIPSPWIRRVMRAESGGRTWLRGRPIVSSAGAMGLMQLMPGTWREMRARLGLGHDPHDPRDNILAGTAYLKDMHDRFGYPGLFAAYNAGPHRYARHLATGRPLPAETVAYVGAVADGHAAEAPQGRGAGAGIFAIASDVRTGSAPPLEADPVARRDTIFVPLGSGRPMPD